MYTTAAMCIWLFIDVQNLNSSLANQSVVVHGVTKIIHDDVIKWKYFPRYWPFVPRIQQVTGEFPSQRPVTRSFDAFFDLLLNKRLSKQS